MKILIYGTGTENGRTRYPSILLSACLRCFSSDVEKSTDRASTSAKIEPGIAYDVRGPHATYSFPISLDLGLQNGDGDEGAAAG